MVKINSRFHQVSWEFLLSCIQVKINGGHVPEHEKEIIVASPWISDLFNPNLRLNSPLYDGVQNGVRRRLASLSQVLITLSELDFKVIVVTSKPGCSKWKRDWSPSQIERDEKLQNKLKSKGVVVLHNKGSHAKSISTPIGVIDGSANLTDNGFFKNMEHMEVTGATESGFAQARHVIQQLIPN
jgi:hypothetical protein